MGVLVRSNVCQFGDVLLRRRIQGAKPSDRRWRARTFQSPVPGGAAGAKRGCARSDFGAPKLVRRAAAHARRELRTTPSFGPTFGPEKPRGFSGVGWVRV